VSAPPLDQLRLIRFDELMMGGAHSNRISFRHVSAWLMLLALVLRLPAPQGWMPNVSGGGTGAFIVICSVHGQMTVQLDANGYPVSVNPDEEPSQGTSQPPCAFAGLGGLGAAPPTPIVVAAPEFAGEATLSVSVTAPAVKRRDGSIGARGPPLRLT
jgi:hypothetical protein